MNEGYQPSEEDSARSLPGGRLTPYARVNAEEEPNPPTTPATAIISNQLMGPMKICPGPCIDVCLTLSTGNACIPMSW